MAAAAVERFPDGSALRPARDAAEAAWARALAAAGREFRSGALLAVAAEALMNVSPWDYYQARPYPTLPWGAQSRLLMTNCLAEVQAELLATTDIGC